MFSLVWFLFVIALFRCVAMKATCRRVAGRSVDGNSQIKQTPNIIGVGFSFIISARLSAAVIVVCGAQEMFYDFRCLYRRSERTENMLNFHRTLSAFHYCETIPNRTDFFLIYFPAKLSNNPVSILAVFSNLFFYRLSQQQQPLPLAIKMFIFMSLFTFFLLFILISERIRATYWEMTFFFFIWSSLCGFSFLFGIFVSSEVSVEYTSSMGTALKSRVCCMREIKKISCDKRIDVLFTLCSINN